ncbi:MAG: hypothetical protein ACE5E1_10540 [Phycisphaerae bacterium]
MRASYALLAASDVLLMVLTAAVGLMVRGQEGFGRHFLLGVLTAMFTSLIHVIFFMYFVVQNKIATQAILQGDVDAALAPRVQGLKARALRSGMVGIGTLLLAVILGALVGQGVQPEAHLVAAFAAMFFNAAVFFYQYTLLVEYADLARAAFGE